MTNRNGLSACQRFNTTYINNHILHPLIGRGVTQINQETVAVPSPYRPVPIPYCKPLLQSLAVVVVSVWCLSLAHVAE